MKSNENLVVNLTLTPWQKPVYKSVMENLVGKIITLRASRQKGKSFLMAAILSAVSLQYPKSESIEISPTYEQCDVIRRTIIKAFEGTGIIVKTNSNYIQFITGSIVHFKSASSGLASLQGYHTMGKGILAYDECAFLGDDIINTTLPFANKNNSTVLCVSTPQKKAGFFWSNDKTANPDCTDKSVISFFWGPEYDYSEFLSDERLQYYSSVLDPVTFTRTIEGQYCDAMDSPWPTFEEVLVPIGSITAQPDEKLFAGIDWCQAREQDYTVCTIMNSKHQMVQVFRWNNLSSRETVDRIAAILKEYNVKWCLAETNSIGGPLLEFLQETVRKSGYQCRIEGFETTNKSKVDIVAETALDIQNKRMLLQRDPELITEMSLFTAEVTPSGRVTYNVPDATGVHDDMVLSLMISNHCVHTYTHSGRNHGMFL